MSARAPPKVVSDPSSWDAVVIVAPELTVASPDMADVRGMQLTRSLVGSTVAAIATRAPLLTFDPVHCATTVSPLADILSLCDHYMLSSCSGGCSGCSVKVSLGNWTSSGVRPAQFRTVRAKGGIFLGKQAALSLVGVMAECSRNPTLRDCSFLNDNAQNDARRTLKSLATSAAVPRTEVTASTIPVRWSGESVGLRPGT